MEINPANRLPMGGLADRAPSSQGYQGVPRATGFSPSSPGRLSASPPDQRIALNLAQGNSPPNFAGSPPDGCRGRPVTLTAGSFPCPVSGSSLAVTPPGGLDLIPHLHQVSVLKSFKFYCRSLWPVAHVTALPVSQRLAQPAIITICPHCLNLISDSERRVEPVIITICRHCLNPISDS